MNQHDNWMWFGGGFMWLFWILLIVIVVLLVRFLINTDDSSKLGESPLAILKKRYANGEINEEEYERHKKELGK